MKLIVDVPGVAGGAGGRVVGQTGLARETALDIADPVEHVDRVALQALQAAIGVTKFAAIGTCQTFLSRQVEHLATAQTVVDMGSLAVAAVGHAF